MNAPLARPVEADPYLDFLRAKMQLAKADGFDVPLDAVNPVGAPHCRAIVRWALKGGSRAIFASFGLHKTFMQIELMRLIGQFVPGLRLIVIPLGVRHEFFDEVKERFSGDCTVKLKFVRANMDITPMITVTTDVVTENNQTYRLTYSEMMKDATKMGVGSPEYVLLFRRPQSDLSRAYADEPVTHDKPMVIAAGGGHERWSDGDRRAQVPGSGYTLARWQLDAHAFWPSSGDRLLTTAELVRLGPKATRELFGRISETAIYDFEQHLRLGEELAERDSLSKTYMTLAPVSGDPGVWTDVVRMETLNGEQAFRNLEKHVCPQFDIVDRLIERYSNKGDIVYDPFGGLMTVPYRAILKGRRGQASELSPTYFRDGLHYCRRAEAQTAVPTMFDLMGIAEAAE